MNPARTAAPKQTGFSLVELMIAMVLGLMIIGSATAVFLSNKQSYRSNNALSQLQEASRIAFELIARDLRGANLTGCGNRGFVGNVLNNGPNRDSDTDGDPTNDSDDVWWSDFNNAVRGYDEDETDPAVAVGTATAARVAGTDSLQLIGISGSGWSVASHDTTNRIITLTGTSSGLVAGDIVIVCDPDNAVIVQVTSFDSSANDFTHLNTGTVTPGNCSSGLRLPTVCTSATGNFIPAFGRNSLVSRMTAADWYIGNNPQGGRSLYQAAMRNNAGAAAAVAQEMIRNVTDMQLQYLQGASYVAATAVTNWSNITAVRMTLTIQGNDLFAGTDVQPISRQFTASVALRNRVN